MTKRELRLAKLNGTLDKVLGAEIDRRIRLSYPDREEKAIHRHMISHPENEKYLREFREYDAFVEQCKSEVRTEAASILGIDVKDL